MASSRACLCERWPSSRGRRRATRFRRPTKIRKACISSSWTKPARKPDLKSLEALKTHTERFVLKGRIFYLHTPNGFGTSKLAKRAERLLGVDATARNWRTVKTLLAMAKAHNPADDVGGHAVAREDRSVRPRESPVSGIFEEEFPRFTAGLVVFDAGRQ